MDVKLPQLAEGVEGGTVVNILVAEGQEIPGGHLAVVTHGLVCRSLAGRHLLLPDGQVVPERWENTAVTIVERLAAREGGWGVRLLNCIAHLDDLAAQPLADSGAA